MEGGVGWRTLSALFLVSAASLAFEVQLTRFFSIVLWHHLAFMVVSIAMLGIGAAGTYLSMKASRDRAWADKAAGWASLGFAAFSLSGFYALNDFPLDPVRLAWSLHEVLYLMGYYVVFGVAFFFVGVVVAALLAGYPCHVYRIYGVNLAGSAVGAGLGIVLLASFPDSRALAPLAAMAVVAAPLFAWGHHHARRSLGAIAIVIVLGLALVPPAWWELAESPYKDLSRALSYPGARVAAVRWDAATRVEVIESEGIHYAPGLSLAYTGTLPPQRGVTVDGDDLRAMPSTSCEPGGWEYTDYLPGAVAYHMKGLPRILLVGPGGVDVHAARCHNGTTALAIDKNEVLVTTFKKQGYDEGTPAVDIVSENERRFLRQTDKRFDVVALSPTQSVMASTAGVFGAGEDYRFTVEAFESYLGALSPDGMLVVTRWLHFPPREHLRMAALARSALDSRGIERPADHLAMFRSPVTYTLVVKRNPMTAAERTALSSFVAERGYSPLYPTAEERAGAVDEVSIDLLDAIIANGTADSRIEAYAFDVSAVTDDRPYPSNYVKWTRFLDFAESVEGRPQALFEGGFLTVAVLVEAVILSLLLVLLAFVRTRGVSRVSKRLLAYFLSIGLAFMFLEVALIQALTLAFGWPLYSFAFVVTVLLLAAGAGSLALPRFDPRHRHRMLLVLPLGALAYAFSPLTSTLLALPSSAAYVLAAAVLIPVGFVMGMPFPLGLGLAAEKTPESIPLLWAVNACSSVVASIAAALLSLEFGFDAVLITAGACYALAYMLIAPLVD